MPIGRTTNTVVIYPNRIESHFTVGGAVYKDGVAIGRRALITARNLAGERTGRLKREITVGYGNRGPYTFVTTMVSRAPYSSYVNDGTLGKIIRAKVPMVRDPKTGRILAGGMHLPPWGAHGAKILNEVKGQYPKKFLQRGMSIALKAQGYSGL